MHYNSKDLTDPESREVFMRLVDDAETVREYVGLYESSPQMKPQDVHNYRRFTEYLQQPTRRRVLYHHLRQHRTE